MARKHQTLLSLSCSSLEFVFHWHNALSSHDSICHKESYSHG